MTNEDIQRALDLINSGLNDFNSGSAVVAHVNRKTEYDTIRQCLTQALEPEYKAIAEESCRILKGIIHCSDKGVKEMLSLYSDGDKIISKYRELKGE